MASRIFVQSLNRFALFLDTLFTLIGWFAPSKNHPWNRQILRKDQADGLDRRMMVQRKGVKAIKRRWWWSILFHIPLLGGWKKYVVLATKQGFNTKWHVGWKASDLGGEVAVSQLTLDGPVRMLIGPDDVSFFGVDIAGVQVPIIQISEGRLGDGNPKGVPLL
jgi:hypothetical protein